MSDITAIAREIAPAILREIKRLRDEDRIDGLWSIADIARWAGVSERKARDLVNTPGFPRSDRLPSDGDGVGHPRWIAAEVIAWWHARRGQ